MAGTLPPLAVAEFIASGACEHHRGRIRHGYKRQGASLVRAVEGFFPNGTRITRPTGGFVVWVQLPEAVNSLQLYLRAIRSKIAIAPGYIFSPSDHYRNFIRLNAAGRYLGT